MLVTLLKLFAYTRAPKKTFVVLHPVRAAQLRKLPWDLKHAYAPPLVAIVTAAAVGPLAFRLGRRSGRGTLLSPRTDE